MTAADLSWAPPLTLPRRGVILESVKDIVLAMAESPAGTLVDQPAMTERIATCLQQLYGIDHDDALAELVPVATATYQAVGGVRHDTRRVDPLFRQQLRHTFTFDGRPLVDRGDAIWDIGHEWKPSPPRKPKAGAKRLRAESKAARRVTQPTRTAHAQPTRLDRLAANVRAARQRQLARRAALDPPAEVKE